MLMFKVGQEVAMHDLTIVFHDAGGGHRSAAGA